MRKPDEVVPYHAMNKHVEAELRDLHSLGIVERVEQDECRQNFNIWYNEAAAIKPDLWKNLRSPDRADALKAIYLCADFAKPGADHTEYAMLQRKPFTRIVGTQVIFNEDLRPITVIDVDEELESNLLSYQVAQIATGLDDLLVPMRVEDAMVTHATYEVVRIRLEWLEKDGKRIPLLIALNQDEAMSLDATFLPGQHAMVYRCYEEGDMGKLMGKV